MLIEDIPPLRMPKVENVMSKSWIRFKVFLITVTPLIIAGAVLYALLLYYGLDKVIVEPFTPIAYLLKLPPETMIPLVYGFF